MTDGVSGRVTAGWTAVRERIATACARAGRSVDDVRLVAVSKRHGPEAIRVAYGLGQREFGENYVQELASKAKALADLPDLELHLIGHLQRNKAKDVLGIGNRLRSIDTLDSARLASALADRARASGRTVEVLIQVNPAAEPQKAGVSEAELPALVAAIRTMPELHLTGLMVIPPNVPPEERRPCFGRVRELAEQFGLRELSMGMTDDLEQAIAEGATQVRVGTAIFGERVS